MILFYKKLIYLNKKSELKYFHKIILIYINKIKILFIIIHKNLHYYNQIKNEINLKLDKINIKKLIISIKFKNK